MSIATLREVERSIPRDPQVIFLVRDVYLAKSCNGEHNVSLRPFDICRLHGRCTRSDTTTFGLLLRWLFLKGYLVEVRAKKYIPTNKFLEWIRVCKYPHCESESTTCGFIEVCPFYELRKIIEKRRKRR